jgi:hypothetical protein
MTGSKICTKCAVTKPLTNFHRSLAARDGLQNHCKQCQLEYRKRNQEATNERQRQRRINNPESVQAWNKSYYEKNRERILEASRAYSKTPKGRLVKQSTVAKWQSKNPIKKKAHRLLNKAIETGKISSVPCIVCGNRKVEAHHPAYSLPLAVSWLCREHHIETHKLFDLSPKRIAPTTDTADKVSGKRASYPATRGGSE